MFGFEQLEKEEGLSLPLVLGIPRSVLGAGFAGVRAWFEGVRAWFTGPCSSVCFGIDTAGSCVPDCVFSRE